jgi:4-hydroxybenzoate polyprenyltransferase
LRLARIDRPIGWWLLLLPCWWSSALAADRGPLGLSRSRSPRALLDRRGRDARAGSTYNDA